MKREIVRLQKVELENLKNVGYGCVKFAPKNSAASDILGLYGQNGSGKTTLVYAIGVLKDLLKRNMKSVMGLILYQKKYQWRG